MGNGLPPAERTAGRVMGHRQIRGSVPQMGTCTHGEEEPPQAHICFQAAQDQGPLPGRQLLCAGLLSTSCHQHSCRLVHRPIGTSQGHSALCSVAWGDVGHGAQSPPCHTPPELCIGAPCGPG